MTLHLYIPEGEGEKDRDQPCQMTCVGSDRLVIDYSCKLCDFHPSTGPQSDEPRCKKGRWN
jgi:hypothetical protein